MSIEYTIVIHKIIDLYQKYRKIGTMADKERITITIDRELLKWIDKKIQDKTFASRSHGIEFLINKAKNDK